MLIPVVEAVGVIFGVRNWFSGYTVAIGVVEGDVGADREASFSNDALLAPAK
jgi:predicted metal-dependent enzyme (double-stranded beta helix superfamily)